MSPENTPVVHASDWQSYLCRVNDHLASAYVDLGLASAAPLPETSKLVWLWIRLNRPREDGLSSDDEFDALCEFEDELEDTVIRYKPSYYVGRITTQGRREFYFYVAKDLEFNKVVDDLLKAHSEFSFQLGGKLDASWRHYFQTLFPGASGLE